MLFKKTETIRQYAELGEINFFSIKPTIRIVEEQFIVPILGKELYNSLDSAYFLISAETSLSPAHQLLLDRCRCVIAPMLCYLYIPKAEVKLSDSGAQRLETANTKTAYQYQGTNYREANLREGEVASELLIEFLEENKASYPEWVASSAFTEYRKLFIKSGKEFNENFSSHSPYRNYWAMRSKMVDVEENVIRTALGDDLFDDLKTKDCSGSVLTAKEQQLLSSLKKAIAYFTVSYAIPFLNVRIDANGITVISNTISSKDDDAKRTATGDTSLTKIINSTIDTANTWLNKAVKFLNDNGADFPLWKKTPAETTGPATINDQLKGSFGMC